MKKTEEKGVIVVHEVKCKLYVKVCAYKVMYGLIVSETASSIIVFSHVLCLHN